MSSSSSSSHSYSGSSNVITNLAIAVVIFLIGYAIGVDSTMRNAEKHGVAEYENGVLVFKYPSLPGSKSDKY